MAALTGTSRQSNHRGAMRSPSIRVRTRATKSGEGSTEFIASVEKAQRELISSGFMRAVEQADATLRRFSESVGGAEGIQRILDEQNRMLRQVTEQTAVWQQLHAITNFAPMEYPRIDPDILYRPRRSAARDRDVEPLPRRTIVRREVKTKIGFIR